jgi:hypothetical protein
MAMSVRGKVRTVVAAAGLLAASLQVAGVQPARADALAPASCIGIEASAVSPPRTSDEFPGGMPELVSFVRDVLGVRLGEAVSFVAGFHEESHAKCDEAE